MPRKRCLKRYKGSISASRHPVCLRTRWTDLSSGLLSRNTPRCLTSPQRLTRMADTWYARGLSDPLSPDLLSELVTNGTCQPKPRPHQYCLHAHLQELQHRTPSILDANWPDRPAGFEQEYPESATRLATQWWLERNEITDLHSEDTLSALIQQRYTSETACENEACKKLDDIFHIHLTACEHFSPAVELPEKVGVYTLLHCGQ